MWTSTCRYKLVQKTSTFSTYEGQKYEIPAQKNSFYRLPPNKYFEVEAINLDDTSIHQKVVIHFQCIPTKPVHFAKRKESVFIIYPKGTPWPNKQPRLHNSQSGRTSKPRKVGFIGLGRMGAAMAGHLAGLVTSYMSLIEAKKKQMIG